MKKYYIIKELKSNPIGFMPTVVSIMNTKEDALSFVEIMNRQDAVWHYSVLIEV